MEPQNQEPVQSAPITPSPESSQINPTVVIPPADVKKNRMKIIILAVVVAVIIIGIAGFRIYKIMYPSAEKLALIAQQQDLQRYEAIKSQIETDGFDDLSKEDYAFYLNYKVDYPASVSENKLSSTQAGGFHLSIDKESPEKITVLGPKVGNKLHILLDQVETINGPEDLSTNSWEDLDLDMFNEVDNYEPMGVSIAPYNMGLRSLRIESEIKDLKKITGRVVVPFYVNTESIILKKGDTEKKMEYGTISAIDFSEKEFSGSYEGRLEYISAVAYGQDGNEIEGAGYSIMGGDYKLNFAEDIYKIKLIFGLDKENIEIPFTLDFQKEVTADSDTSASATSSGSKSDDKSITNSSKSDTSSDEDWVVITDQARIKSLQKTVAEFDNLFKKGDASAIIAYNKISKVFDEESAIDLGSPDSKEMIRVFSDTAFSATESSLIAMKDVSYELNDKDGLNTWLVYGVSAKDPIFEMPAYVDYYIEEINGKLYVIDFDMTSK